MTRLTTKLFVVALSAVSLTIAGTADAGCGGGGYGGLRGPNYPSYRRVVRSAPQPQFRAPVQQQQFQPPQQAQAPAQQPRVIGQQPQQQQAPAQQAPTQQGLGALGNTQQAQQNNQQTAEMTALQALAAMGGNQPQTQPAQQAQPQQTQPQQTQPAQQQAQSQATQANPNVGTWVAKVGAEATVQLDLRADGSFTWTATRNGKTSNFAGQYDINGGTLTLTRGDNQSLAGDMTVSSNGFNFKLSGGNDAGLNFARG